MMARVDGSMPPIDHVARSGELGRIRSELLRIQAVSVKNRLLNA
jgi:hypothetical protein